MPRARPDARPSCGADPAIVCRTRREAAAGRPRSSSWPATSGEALAGAVAARAREVALATLCGNTAVEVAIVDRQGGIPRAGRRVTAQRHLLILGGTAEAAALARGALSPVRRCAGGHDLARRKDANRPAPLPGQVRIGGFGGPAGLAAYLRGASDRPADRRDPSFRGPDLARRAARLRSGRMPRLLLLRPPWQRHPLDRWIEVR